MNLELAETDQKIRKEENAQVAQDFFRRLKHSKGQLGYSFTTAVRLTLYWKNRLARYSGSLLFINESNGLESIQVKGRDKEGLNNILSTLLNDGELKFALGRSGTELIVERTASWNNDIIRIDIEEEVTRSVSDQFYTSYN